MHVEDIKGGLRKRGYTLKRIAEEMEVSLSHVSKVLRVGHRSERIERRIADILDRPVERVFPNRYKKAA